MTPMRISRRFRKGALEAAVVAAGLLDGLWWRTDVVLSLAAAYVLWSYLWYRREAIINFRKSAPLRRAMSLSHIKAIEKEYTMRPDFNTPEKRALVRGPLERYFYHARYTHACRLLDRFAGEARRVLDMGCGFGKNTLYVAQQLHAMAVGLELDSLKLAWGQRKLAAVGLEDSAALVCGDASHPPFRSESFECILMAEVLEHLIDPARALAACRYLLCPGGLLLITTPSSHNLAYCNNPLYVLEKILSLATDMVLPPYHNLHARFEFNWRSPESGYGTHYHFSRQRLERLLQEAGFRTVWRGSFEIEILPYLVIEFMARGDMRVIEKYVSPVESLLQRLPLARSLGQHLLWVAKKG